MNEEQNDALLEEIRKLRGEVRAVRQLVNFVIGFLVVVLVTVADKVKWLTGALFGTALAFGIVGLIWLGWQAFKLSIEDRRKQAAATRIVTSRQPSRP